MLLTCWLGALGPKNSKVGSLCQKNGCGKTRNFERQSVLKDFRLKRMNLRVFFEKTHFFFGGAVLELDDSKVDFGLILEHWMEKDVCSFQRNMISLTC